MNENHAATPISTPAARLRYVHLYMPVVTALLILSNRSIVKQMTKSMDQPANMVLVVAASAIPTYLVGSCLYPAERPEPTAEESIRFTRKNEACRAIVLATYGRLFGTAFNLRFFIADFCCSYVAGEVIGERPAGSRQRRSEFLVALLWVMASRVLMSLVPLSMETAWLIVGGADRTLWRAAYLALVDDVVRVLARPDVGSVRGKATLVLVQALSITSLVYVGLALMRRAS